MKVAWTLTAWDTRAAITRDSQSESVKAESESHKFDSARSRDLYLTRMRATVTVIIMA